MKLFQVALLFTIVMVAHVAASNKGPSRRSVAEEFQLEIPENCKKLGFCEDIPNYPKELADKAISEVPDLSTFHNDLPDTRREGPQEENIELCQFEEKVVHPKAAVDSSGKWHVVLNKDDDPVQGFKVEICNQDLSPCSGVVVFGEGLEGVCEQKFIEIKMAVLVDDGSHSDKLLKMPSNCLCAARPIKS